ncbi:PPOX class F420-dependent oxidoreductase [Nonomuraea typhae]|uniref:PPOX class F420-dependent oxidoreductase n=1 Tax=Nonomuraea typhae TaxID=2603600 RepID=UPI0012F85035|nr:PPOX class F420-dependent oxidoreductase [Nonomuraea typhae]
MSDLVPRSHADILESKGFASVATVTKSRRPHVSPTWYLWDGDRQHLLISLTDVRQKYRNLRRNPEIAVCIPDPVDPYRYIELRGRVESIQADVDHRFIDLLARKYLNQQKFSDIPADGNRLVVRIAPEYVRCFG